MHTWPGGEGRGRGAGELHNNFQVLERLVYSRSRRAIFEGKIRTNGSNLLACVFWKKEKNSLWSALSTSAAGCCVRQWCSRFWKHSRKNWLAFNMFSQCFCYCCSVPKLCPTHWKPMNYSMPGFLVLHHLPKFSQTHVHWIGDAIQPSHLLLPPSLLALNLSQHQGLYQWVSSLHQVAKLLELQLQHQSFQWVFRVDFLCHYTTEISKTQKKIVKTKKQTKPPSFLKILQTTISTSLRPWHKAFLLPEMTPPFPAPSFSCFRSGLLCWICQGHIAEKRMHMTQQNVRDDI